MFKLIALLFLFFTSFCLNAVVLEDYLPKDTRYDISIPSPRAVTGLEVGERHYRHDQIVTYLSILAASSARARLVDYGMTNEGRRLVLLFISSNKNMENLEALATNDKILRVWNGFSVHGNEASGTNASILYAYHLVAGHSDKIDKILNETLIIIDPTINPDGYDRYITDINSHRGIIDNSDANDLAHKEQLPNGRTNHYYFDLNRDWLLLSQVESQARIKAFHQWNPHVLDDHHEMGSDKTFFFQPGVPERANPLIPAKNIELTTELAKYHAKTLSEKGMRFYSQESYDDFYPGKGSTYPDLHGSIGILFEQARANGGNLSTDEGMRTLVDGIDNQFRTALSTLTGAFELKEKLLKYKNDFFKKALDQARTQDFNGYLLDFEKDSIKAQKMADYLSIHNIKVKMLDENITLNKHTYHANSSLYIAIVQKQYTLIKSLFNTDTQFKDNTFYDVSAWNIAMAWGLDYARIKTTPKTKEITFKATQNHYDKDAIAYAFNWDQGNTAAALNYLQQRDINTKATKKPFKIKANGKTNTFNPGTIIIDLKKDDKNTEITKAIANTAEFFQVPVYALTAVHNTDGIDLGSPAVVTLKKPKVLMVMGEGINSYQTGSIWHLFDTQVGLPLTKINKKQLAKIQLSDYSHMILPSGNYKSLTEKTNAKIKAWIKQGGHLISFQKSAKWAEQNLQNKKKETQENPSNEEPEIVASLSYGDFEKDLARNTIGGAIISAHADLTHPLAYGMHQQTQYALLKGNSKLKVSQNPYTSPLKANKKPLAAGYLSEEKQKQFAQAPLVIAERSGKGSIIKFGFNPTFRGYWLGTQKWLINAIYFASLIDKTEIKK
jgi:hypothetical protein